MKKLFKALLVCACVFSLAACGQKKDSNKFIIATDTAFVPFEWKDGKGKLTGIDIDLMNAIAKNQGFTVEWKSIGFDASMTAVEAGEADGMIAGMTINDSRKKKYDFSDPYYTSSVSMATAKGSGIKSYNDLKGKTVVAKTSTSGFEFANANKKKYGYKLEVVEESSIMYQKVKNGDAVALFEDTPVIKYNIASKQVNFELPTGTEGEFNYGFAVYKGSNKELLKKFNAGLKALKENGEYDKILKKYLG